MQVSEPLGSEQLYSVQSFLRLCYLHHSRSAADLAVGARSGSPPGSLSGRRQSRCGGLLHGRRRPCRGACSVVTDDLAMGARSVVAANLGAKRDRHGWLAACLLLRGNDANQASVFWHKLWKLSCPPKVKHFMWRLARNSLALKMNIQRRGMIE